MKAVLCFNVRKR